MPLSAAAGRHRATLPPILAPVTTPRDDLFDLAVNKAADYVARLGLASDDPGRVRSGLEVWYLKTRFAYRVPLDEVAAAVARRPSVPDTTWTGGRGGAWTRAVGPWMPDT